MSRLSQETKGFEVGLSEEHIQALATIKYGGTSEPA